METLDFIILLALVANIVLVGIEIFLRISGDKHLDEMIRHIHHKVVGQSRDLSQHRYYIATLRRAAKKAGMEIEAEEEGSDGDKLLQSAVAQLAEAGKSGSEGNQGDPAEIAEIRNKDTSKLKDKEVLQLVQDAVKNDRIDVSFQPIVSLPRRIVRHYETFARISMGKDEYISAGQFISLASNNNLIPAIDNIILLKALQRIKQNQSDDVSRAYFCNISVKTLDNRKFMKELVEFLEVNPKLSSRIVFEFSQADTMKISDVAKTVMDGLSMLGCRFSMDNVTALGFDIDRLVARNISFVKLNAETVASELRDPKSRGRMKRIKNNLDGAGIEAVIEKIENEKQVATVMEIYPDYGQGYLFGKPQ